VDDGQADVPASVADVRISVVTPSYNQGRYLEAAIRSVLDQGYPDVEYIVIDGGSTDESGTILDRYAPQLAYHQSEPDKGQTDALIQGFQRATGDILAWLNADDLYEPTTFAEVAHFFDSHPDAQFVFGDSTWIDEDGRRTRRKREMPFLRFVWLRTYNYIPQPSAFWKRSLYERVGGLDSGFDLAMDTDLWLRFSERARMSHVPRPWSRMRRHAQQKNVRLRARSDAEDARIRRRAGVPTGLRGAIEGGLAKFVRVAWRGAIGAYWR
jgi:glycosyltransferase involved in cell wall biosynthesis